MMHDAKKFLNSLNPIVQFFKHCHFVGFCIICRLTYWVKILSDTRFNNISIQEIYLSCWQIVVSFGRMLDIGMMIEYNKMINFTFTFSTKHFMQDVSYTYIQVHDISTCFCHCHFLPVSRNCKVLARLMMKNVESLNCIQFHTECR